MRKSTFQFFCCKNSRLDHACNSIMCDRCMQIWITTGRRSGDQPTEEEKDLQMKTAAEVKKKMKGMTAKERRKLRGGNIRPSRRTLVNSVCSKQTSHSLTIVDMGTVITAKRAVGSVRPTRFISKRVGEASNKIANWYHCIALIVRVLF